jgi:hypothetical protein
MATPDKTTAMEREAFANDVLAFRTAKNLTNPKRTAAQRKLPRTPTRKPCR